jgi:3-dehydrosphinganine reductase
MIWPLFAVGSGCFTFGLFYGLKHLLCYQPHRIPLQGAHVMITGGSSGIGLALALQCIREGAAHLCIIGSTESRLETAACLLRDACSPSQKITTIVHDVALVTLVQALQAHTRDHRPVDILVTSAGVTRPALFDETDPGTFDRLMRVNYLGTVHSVLGVLEGMKRRSRGRIIFVSSMAGQAGIVGYGAYSPTKFAVRGLAEVLSMELSPWGIGVAVCNPPNVDTPMYAGEMETPSSIWITLAACPVKIS